MSTRLMIVLCVAYGVIAVAAAAAYDRHWPRVLYFVGAILISVAVLWMGESRE